ncbi:SDR family oxidoreductase [Piscinibacter sakaiensis]|uniref:Oxidoreductase, short-chain dehydrogenase/reductase family n=1 Tax=Piscinibacter sakaiensis TaxID=1547922 RepID=A0A0K8P3K6_PISS1|nr:SDR family oxidoreductase [Piscinibacter sakaiensis]GAP37218.1 oxidoreductase, short-chain dehydrogenase/reductase family [Piscinibacter sakaiensis]
MTTPTDLFDFNDRHVFVAGGSSGINLGIAEAFAARGARVAIASRSQERIDAAVAGLRRHGGEAAGWSADVRSPEAIGAALAAAHARFGAIDVLVSGAAGNFVAPALGMSPNGFKTVVDIDLNGTFNVLRLAHEFLRKPGASVINITAAQSFNPSPYQAHVCAAKAGVDMLTRTLAMEWGADGIRINSILPGPIEATEGVRRLAPNDEARRRMLARIPLGRFGALEDVANMALVLSSPLATYVTGAIVPVDGGGVLSGSRDFSASYVARP